MSWLTLPPPLPLTQDKFPEEVRTILKYTGVRYGCDNGPRISIEQLSICARTPYRNAYTKQFSYVHANRMYQPTVYM